METPTVLGLCKSKVHIPFCVILIMSHMFNIVEKWWTSFKSYGHFVPQKNVHTLQSAVDSLQKEKEELVLALQSAKKDTNQAKYEHLIFFFPFVPVAIYIQYIFLYNIKSSLISLHSSLPSSSDILHLLLGLVSSGGRDCRNLRASL